MIVPQNMEDARVSLMDIPSFDGKLAINLENGGVEKLIITEEIGRGGSCIVYLARVEGAGTDAHQTRVVKEFYPIQHCNPDDLPKISRSGLEVSVPTDEKEEFELREERFKNGVTRFGEYYEWDQGKHSTAMPSFGEANGTSYAISHLAGDHLLSKEPPMDLNSIAQVMQSVCMALEPFHKHGVLYLDCKPANIYWYEIDNTAKTRGSIHGRLFDFDTAVVLSELKSGERYFTSYSETWAAPEQVEWAKGLASASELSLAADIWAVGAVFFWLLTGHSPSWEHGGDVASDVDLIKEGLFAWESMAKYSLRFDRSGKGLDTIDAIARKTLCRNPESRSQSVAELATDFAKLAEISGYYENVLDALDEKLERFHQLYLQQVRDKSDEANDQSTPNEEVDESADSPIEAWGPRGRETFTYLEGSPYPVFNSLTDNPSLGDERNFVRVREAGTDAPFSDNADIVPGRKYEIFVYYNNNARAELNETGEGVANNVRLSIAFPNRVYAGEAALVKGTISSTNSFIDTVFDSAFLHASETIDLHYITNSATIHCSGSANGKHLNDQALLSKQGVLLAYYDNYWGVIPGSFEYAGFVTFEIATEKAAEQGPEELHHVKFESRETEDEMRVLIRDTRDGELLLLGAVSSAYALDDEFVIENYEVPPTSYKSKDKDLLRKAEDVLKVGLETGFLDLTQYRFGDENIKTEPE